MVEVTSSKNIKNVKIDTSMIDEFYSPAYEQKNQYMYINEEGFIVYKDIDAVVDDINDSGRLAGISKVVLRDWEQGHVYHENETAVYNNGIYKCIVTESTANEFVFNEWRMIAGYSKSSEFFKSESAISEIVLEEAAATKGCLLINVDNSILLSKYYSLGEDGKTITFDPAIPANSDIEVIVYGNMIIPTNVDNIITKTFRPLESTSEFFFNDNVYKKDLITVNIDGVILTQDKFEINTLRNGIILNTPVPANTLVQVQYFNNLDLGIGGTFIPHVNIRNKQNPTDITIADISWTNDQGLVNPQQVTIKDGVTFTPHTSGETGEKQHTISWTNNGGKQNPETITWYDGATFTPTATKSGYTTTLSWDNDSGLVNPRTVYIFDGVNYFPTSTRNDNTVTISWDNDQGKQNPESAVLYDGATFTPTVSKIGYTTTLSWTNDSGLENPQDTYILDGVIWTPHTNKSGIKTTLSWTNDQGKQNPADVIISDGATFTPSWSKSGYISTISWTNNDNLPNPSPMNLYDGVNFIPSTSRSGNETTISWTNDQGLENPNPAVIYDGAIFTPHTRPINYVDTQVYWTNDRGLENPNPAVITGGVTFTPEIEAYTAYSNKLSWTNNGGLNNPSDLIITDGVNYTPSASRDGYTTTISWTNDQGKQNPAPVQILDGAIFTPSTSKSGIKTTLSWTNNQGLQNPADAIISDGATFTPTATKSGKVVTISWTNNDNLPNPENVTLEDGVIWTPSISRDGYTTTLSWTNDSGLENPLDSYIYDGAIFTPHTSAYGNVDTKLSWTNNQGLQNPADAIITGGATFTPTITRINSYTDRLSWTNNNELPNPSTIDIVDGVNWTPIVTKDEQTSTTTISWTNDQGKQNPAPVQILDGKVNDVLLNGESIVSNRIASFTLGTMAQESASDYVTLSAYNTKIGELEDADTALETAIEAEETRATNAESGLRTDLTAETTRATNAESGLRTDLTAETTRATNAESGLRTDLTAETTRATTAEQALESAIDTEETRAKGIENGLRADLTAETTRATNAESGLQSQINDLGDSTTELESDLSNEITRATTAEQAIASDLSDEITRATTAEQALDTAKVDKVSGNSKIYGTDATGNQTTYDYDSFGKVDDVKVAGTSVVTNKIANLGSMASETAADYYKKTDLATIATTGSWNNLSNTPTTISGYGITDAYTKTEIDGKLAAAMHFKGTVATSSDLNNIQNPAIGDMYNVLDSGSNYAWDGTDWDKLSETLDLSPYDNHIVNTNNPHGVTKAQVGLGNVDNTSDANKPVSTAQQTALNTKVDKVSGNSKIYGTDATGNQTTYDYDSFGKVDDVKVNGTSVVANKIASITLGTMATETASDYYTKSGTDTLLNGKEDTITGAATTITSSNLTANRAVMSNSSGKVAVSSTTSTELGYLHGVTSAVQTQLDSKVAQINSADKVYGTDSTGNQSSYDANDLINKVTDVKVNGSSVVTNKIASITLGTMATETASDYSKKIVADTLYAAKSLETTVSNIDEALSQEIQRATDRETALNTKIEDEITRASGVESGLQSSKADKSTTYTKTEIDGMMSGAMHFRGTVATVADLNNIQNPAVGDLYNVTATGANYAWDGTQWVKMAENIDLSPYALTADVNTALQTEITARQNADATKVDKVTAPSRVYGTDELGQPITYGVALFGNIDDVTVGGTSVVVNRIAPLGTMAGETAADYSTKAIADTLYAAKSLETTVSNLTTTVGDKVDKVSGNSKIYGTTAAGVQTTYNLSDLQNTVVDVKVNGTSVVANKIASITLGTMATETASDYYTKTSADAIFATKATTYTKTEVDTIVDDLASVVIRDWSV